MKEVVGITHVALGHVQINRSTHTSRGHPKGADVSESDV